MRWRGRRQSTNVEDRRGGGGRRIPLSGKLKFGGIGTIVIVIGALVMGVDPRALMPLLAGGGDTGSAPARGTAQVSPEEAQRAEFVKVVLADTEDVWNRLFPQALQRQYEPTVLVLFSDTDRSGCGFASAATGPFYCPADRKVYIDLSFFRDLDRRFGAPGDFAQAYVVAHEVGHHIQTLLGISREVHARRRAVSEVEGNRLSVKQELQADCFSGVWAHHAQKMNNILEEGDIEEALGAATAIGDDRLQRSANRQVVPESFTHGTSEQRVRWFSIGFRTGNLSQCDTFSASSL